MKKSTSRIVKKFIDKQLHTPNMVLGTPFIRSDIPFKRPKKYYFRLENNEKVKVTQAEYEKYKEGDLYSYLDQGMDQQVQTLAISVFVALLFVLLTIIIFYLRLRGM